MAQPRLLIANRGEIAVRVMRTCREMGIPTVAVYSDADREALFVEMADDAYHLGPSSPSESYLNVPRILEVAGRARATLVHPGYGFLAENAGFARAVAEAGLTFVGPPPAAMTLMGDKAAARRTAEGVGAPTIPGTPEPITADRAAAEADRIGFPIVVKAAFGGGGKGMHLVDSPDELPAAVERSSREANAYFSRPEVYLERYITRAHHVEAQIVADRHGHVSFLGERDCSLQRRYQKLVEESPSPVVDEWPARRPIRGDEARPREEVPIRGHAIECRINAEDPYRDFLPGPGLITSYRPPGGPFVRLDSGVAEGRRVVGDYDSLVAKLV